MITLSKKVAIIAGEYHKETVKKMINEADSVLAEHNLSLFDICWVPGSMEKPLALKHFLKLDEVDAAVVLGVIEKGETMHGEIMGHSVINAILSLQLEFMKPIGIGIIGPGVDDNQIEERIIPYAKNAVKAVVSMLSLGS